MKDEMAHYACCCFDAEIFSSYGWVECVGLADRSAYDLTNHQRASKQNLSAFINFPEGPRDLDITVIIPNKQLIGKQFKKDGAIIISYLESVTDDSTITEIKNSIDTQGFAECSGFQVPKDMIKIETLKKRVTGRNVVPNVIEPAFGIGRIMYSMLDHAYYVRPEDDQRSVFQLKPRVAPFLTTILPLLTKDNLIAKVYEIEILLKKKSITTKLDCTGVAIGRRYARTDELGIPFGITVDYTTLKHNTVTLRERDSTEQVRVPINELAVLLLALVSDEISWTGVKSKYPIYVASEDKSNEDK